MPRKFKTAASTAQNRESQRRSRVRRKELVDDLKRRLDEYERRGAAASLEIQAAAKAVNAENAQLRVLLEMHGVSRQQVDGHLATVRLAGTVDAGDEQHEHPSEESCRQQQQGREESALSEPSLGQGPPIPPSSLANRRAQQEAQLPEAANMPPQRPHGTLETSCDMAAAILVQLHHQTDAGRARAALGCTGTSNCSVKNLRIFQLMDSLLG